MTIPGVFVVVPEVFDLFEPPVSVVEGTMADRLADDIVNDNPLSGTRTYLDLEKIRVEG